MAKKFLSTSPILVILIMIIRLTNLMIISLMIVIIQDYNLLRLLFVLKNVLAANVTYAVNLHLA